MHAALCAVRHWKVARLHDCVVLARYDVGYSCRTEHASSWPSSQHGDDLTSRRISPPTREIANCTRDTRTDTPYTKHLHNGPQGSLLERSR
jgi:hypothetical protein